MERWYVVQTKPNQETLAVQQLRNQKFEVFFPTFLHKVISKRTGLPLQRVLPLFPSYMFARFDTEAHPRWRSINGTRGVLGFVGFFEEYLTPLPQGCIEEIMARVGEEGHIPLEQNTEKFEFKPGMQLEILSEALKGFVGTYCNHTRKLVTLNIVLLNKAVRVIIPIDAVRPINPKTMGGR